MILLLLFSPIPRPVSESESLGAHGISSKCMLTLTEVREIHVSGRRRSIANAGKIIIFILTMIFVLCFKCNIHLPRDYTWKLADGYNLAYLHVNVHEYALSLF